MLENSHSYYERQLSPDDTFESLKTFVKLSCQNLFDVLQKNKGALKKFFETIFTREMERRGYSVKQLRRSYDTPREKSIVAFLTTKNGQKLLDVYLYNVDSQYIGI